MNNDPPQLPEQKPTPSVDDLIAQSTSQLYAFEHSKQKSSVKHRLVALSKTQKLVFGGAGLLLILVVMIGLSLGSGSKQTLSSSQGSTSGTTTTTTSTPATSDTNGDGVIDEYDTASTDETDTNETSWWQKLLNLNNDSGDTTTASSNETGNTSNSSSTVDSNTTASATELAQAEDAETEDVNQQIASSPPSTPTPTSTSSPTPTTPTTPSPTPATVPSALQLSGVTNFRDAAASSTKLMKSGVLYRSAKLQKATKEDAATLASLLKNGAIIDLRTTKVRSSSPDAVISGVTNVSYPIDAADNAKTYVAVFVNTASDRKKFGDAITKIANTKGSVLVHCTAGKDRTGWTVAMVMYAIGANDKQVMTEYLKSRESGATVDSKWLNGALSVAKKKNGGSIINYIKSKNSGLGVSNATITKLKAKLSASK